MEDSIAKCEIDEKDALFKLELKKGIVGGIVYVILLNLGQGRSKALFKHLQVLVFLSFHVTSTMSTNSRKRERDRFGFIVLAPRPPKNKTN